ncbi:mandelate racemase/muconate lactonizing enzyme family protein [Notoacmeibacter sp. MSK16QG-6]|uniref:L-talarate/galactarate dehydratase n=1 Tax=Notoacmeibacter sp. MSK16QG-6 TaxID=2957982 RepID=UPI00209EBE60|nr:mandelate racemase/muconate lactonizing enzyme family protein [Notoacmeibacter sp. MSK16QG-6]MCP1199563.1 mandelate racemase/muconate lactonizing enzyme family protein [Notoacmeibacter sp. MSK16QG-6]
MTETTAMSTIEGLKISQVEQPLKTSFSDAKVATGRQTPLTRVDVLSVEIIDSDGKTGIGFGYTLRAGGSALYALAKEIAPTLIGLPTAAIQDAWDRLAWRTNSLGAGGAAYQTIAAFDSALWDLKARRANLTLADLLGTYRRGAQVYNSGGQYLQASIDEMQAAAKESVARGIGGIKMKVGQPDWREDIRRIEAVRDAIGPDVALMIDANQQWTRSQARAFCSKVDDMGLTFIEEPLNARDYEGHGELAAALNTPIATGEMLTSYAEHAQLIAAGVSVNQVDAPRIGGITPFLRVMELARSQEVMLAPHFVMEQHLQMVTAYPTDGWVEHFDWLEDLFDERFELKEGRIWLPERPGFGLTLSDAARERTVATSTEGAAL